MRDSKITEMECFCENLRKYRKEKNLTQEHLAHKTGFHRTYISALESGRINPTLTTLIKLSRELGVDVCYLLISTKKIGE